MLQLARYTTSMLVIYCITHSITVAILAQGTHWAVATSQAFCLSFQTSTCLCVVWLSVCWLVVSVLVGCLCVGWWSVCCLVVCVLVGCLCVGWLSVLCLVVCALVGWLSVCWLVVCVLAI
jgi:hypothetical protein